MRKTQEKTSPSVPDTIRVVPVTPEVAKAWLETRDDRERNLKPTKVGSIVRDMEDDNWYFTGDPIRFNEDGQLIDGQHRLTGIVITGKTFPFPVVNLPHQARHVIDTGTTRTLGDVLQLGGHVDGRVLGGIARRILVHRRGIRVSSDGRYAPSMTEMVQFIEDNAEMLRQAVVMAQHVYRAGGGGRLPALPSIVGALWFDCSQKDSELAEWFFNRLADGIGLKADDPVYVLRNKLQAVKNKTGQSMSADDQWRYIVRAWNYTRVGARIVRLQEPKGGWNADNTPEIE